jgi:PAS domain S-box-containing protein
MKKILAIDDQQDNLTTIKAVIMSHLPDSIVFTALSGKEGILIAKQEQPDTILLDIIMPKMDGYEVCKELKADDSTKHIPIVMITAIKTDVKSRVKGLEVGADAFVAKPIDPIELSAQIKVMLRIKEAEDKLRADKDKLEAIVLDRTHELSASKQKYKTLYNFAPIPYQSLNEDGSINDVNPEWLNTLGYEKNEVIGKLYEDFIHPDDRPVLQKNFPVLKKLGYVHEVPFRLRHKDGHHIDISLEGCSGYNPDGTFKQIYCVFQDVTEQKKAEKQIRKLSTAIEQSPSVIVITDLNGTTEYVNPKFTSLTGYTLEEAIGENPRILKSGEQSAKVYKEMWKTISKGKEWHGEFHNKKKNGVLFWESVSISPIFDNQGKITNYLKVAEDITERKNADNALRKSESLYRNLVEVIPDGVYKSTEEGKFVEVNPAMVKMLGYASKKELMAIDIKTQLYFEISDRESVVLQENLEEVGIYRMKKKDGSEIWVEDHGWLTADKGTNAIFHEGIMRDITERKKSDELLRASEERYKNFISQVSEGVYRFELDVPMSIELPVEEQIDFMYEHMIIAECNQSFMDLYDIASLEDVIGKTQKQMHGGSNNPENREALRKFIASAYRSENNETVEPDSKGNIRYFSNNSIGIIKDGYLIRTWGTQSDITERVKNDKVKQILYDISKAANSIMDLSELTEFIRFEL